MPVKHLLKKTLRFVLWIGSGIIILLLVLVLLIQVPAVQQWAAKRAVSYLQRKLGTAVRVERLRIIFPKQVELDGVFLGDKRQDTLLSAGRLRVDVSMFGLLHHRISIGSLILEDVRAKVYRLQGDTAFNYAFVLQAFASAPDTTRVQDTTGGFTYALGTVRLRHIDATYRDDATGLSTGLRLGNLALAGDRIDPSRNTFTLRYLTLDSTAFSYNDSTRRQPRGLDDHHLDVRGLTLATGAAGYTPDGITADFRQLALREQSGLTLTHLSAGIVYTATGARLDHLVLKTDRTTLLSETVVHYPSIDTLSHHLELLSLDTRVDKSTIDARDILLFAPALEGKLKGSVYLDGQVRGRMDHLTIPGLSVRALRKTAVSVKGTVDGLPDAVKARYDLQILQLVTDSTDVGTLVPRGTLPASLHLPRDFSATGRFKGTTRVFQALLDATTSNGQARIEGSMNLNTDAYQAKITTRALDLGYLLGQARNVGRLTLTADAQGQGFRYPSLHTDAHLHLVQGVIRGYGYTSLNLAVRYHNGDGTVHSDIDDPAVKYTLDATMHGPALHLVLQLDTLDATALHLVADTLRASGLLRADFASTNPDSLQGNLDLLHTAVYNGGRHLHTDSVALVALHPADSQYIHLYSEAAVLDLDGRYRLTQIPAALEQTIRQYYALPALRDSAFAPESWVLHARVTPTPLLLSFVPDLAGSDTIGLHTTFDSRAHDVELSLATPAFRYGADTVSELHLAAATAATQLNYNVTAAKASVGGRELNRPAVRGRVEHNALYTTALLRDAEGKDWYKIGARLQQGGYAGNGDTTAGGYDLALTPDSLLLNHTAWTVSADNKIHYDSTGITVHHLRLGYKDQSVTVQSQGPALDVAFARFQLVTLTRFLGGDTALVNGTLDGKADVTNVTKSPVFTSDLTVRDLAFRSDTLGNLGIKVNNEVASTYAADVTLKGPATDLALTGKYDTAGTMDLFLRLNAFDLKAIEPLAAGQLDDIRGQLKGNMHMTGTPAKFVPEGHLHFENAVITPHISGEPLRLSADSIEFDNTGFNFSMFALQDSAGNKATLDGNVYTTDYRAMRFDLTFNAGNFRLVNAAPAPDRLFYGKLNLDAAVNLQGDVQSPKMDGDVRINRRTDFTFVLPESDPEVVSRVGVVRFVDKNHPADTLSVPTDVALAAPMTGLNMSANIETDSLANFTMIIDQRNGDALKIRGRSHLNFGLDESGKTSLTGVYEVDAGQYNLTLQLLKKSFLLQRGSTITWTGDPTSARIDLVANYPISTAPIDLVQNEISGRSATDIARFKQKLPFTVALKMTGELLKPVITFDITLPSGLSLQWPDVETKLTQIRSDPSELNKQVFALLLLGRFVGDNPLESGAGSTTAGQMAFQSASQLLTAQLNQLAASLIKGVDINFDLNNTQDYSTGQEQDQTDLAVTVSKSLFNDRVKVNVGSDFELQGAYPNQNASNIAGDLSVDYQLTKDGRYMVRAYRKNQYQVVVEGQVVETGVSFILTLDYNKFREIFGKYNQEKLEERKRKKNG